VGAKDFRYLFAGRLPGEYFEHMLNHCRVLLLFGFPLFCHAEDLLLSNPVFSGGMLSVSAVKGQESQGFSLMLKNVSDKELELDAVFTGKDARWFEIVPEAMLIGSGENAVMKVSLNPEKGKGRYSAVLEIGGQSVPLEGIALEAFEGKNEPPLAEIADALGLKIDVGGTELPTSTEVDRLGDSLALSHFRGIAGKMIRVTPVARFSPTGDLPFGIISEGGKTEKWLDLADSNEFPDNHQCLFPEMKSGKGYIEKAAPDGMFSFYSEGHKFVSSTDPAFPSKAKIKHKARVYEVKEFQGRPLTDAFLLGFEEAQNGDYQDCVFLVENVSPVTP
jgi:hypothetical protein